MKILYCLIAGATLVAAQMDPNVTETMAPTEGEDFPDPACSANEFCAAQNLTGLCCPSTEGELLACCYGSVTETQAPTGTPPVFQEPECSANPTCANASLTGLCCPTADGMNLDCCGGEIAESCSENPVCVEVGLTGACCPTTDGKYLDCCEVVPNECTLEKWENYECGYDSRQYKAELDARSAAFKRMASLAFAGLSLMYLAC
jgi:hypothetical protein